MLLDIDITFTHFSDLRYLFGNSSTNSIIPIFRYFLSVLVGCYCPFDSRKSCYRHNSWSLAGSILGIKKQKDPEQQKIEFSMCRYTDIYMVFKNSIFIFRTVLMKPLLVTSTVPSTNKHIVALMKLWAKAANKLVTAFMHASLELNARVALSK